MAVRNFWIDLDVDGRKTHVATGPRSRDGGFDMAIKIRDEGGIAEAMDVTGRVIEGENGESVLSVTARDPQGNELKVETKR